ncbi:MAG: pyridoxamine 5'-phosphate oxidase family protein [Dehalococcoidia bacterium]
MTWAEFAETEPDLAYLGAARLETSAVALLVTVSKDGSRRVHPVEPVLGQGHLFVFVAPASGKGDDLRRNGRYILHSPVRAPRGGQGGFSVEGRAAVVMDPAIRALADQAVRDRDWPTEQYDLFEFSIESAEAAGYENDRSYLRRWRRA